MPTAGVTPPAAPLIGEPLIFPVTFDNTGSATGYGPYVDLVLPATGADGAGAAVDDGITFGSATFLGAPVTSVVLTFDASGNATHPYARTAAGAAVVVTGTPGYQLVVLQLPFGSFTTTQPAATVQVNATLSPLADANTTLDIRARGGFQYGADALSNPTTDPSIIGAYTANQPVTPAIWRLAKTYIGPEDETATGPNFPRQYRIDVDIAPGQTVTNVDLTDALPGNLQYLAVVSTLINNAPAAATAVATPSTTTPGGTLTRRFATVTGTAGTQDASLIFSYYVPRVDSGATAVIDPVSGDDATSVDDARAQGDWTPLDGRDAPTAIVSDVTAIDHTLTPKSIAIQKSVAIAVDTGGAGATPGDTLEYTLAVQVSDYFAMQDLVITDLISDGQRWAAGVAPIVTIAEHSGGTSAAAAMNAANYVFAVSGTTGETTATFQIGAEQLIRGLDSRLMGGCVPAGGTGGPPPDCAVFNGGATTVTVVYRTVIQENFSNTYPSGDASVDHGDRLTNAVTAQADLLSVANPAVVTGSNEADTSGASVTILSGTLTKSIYAINGNTSFGTARLGPGDTVTYRLRYTLPSSDLEPVTISDYLPLPVLFATEVAGPFVATGGAGIPAAGTAKFGPGDTFFALSGAVPTISVDAAGNAVSFSYPAFDDPTNTPTAIEILFTVTASNQPFADGLFLTNQARVLEGTTNAGQTIVDAIVQILLNEPNVAVTKGVVTSSNSADVYAPTTVGPVSFSAPGTAGYRGSGTITSTGLAATPINSNVSALDAGDVVTFAVVVQNTGSGPEGAFDVTFRDTIPAGFVAPANLAALNLSVTDGTGAALAFTDLGGGPFAGGGGLFGSGLRLNDPSASQGALATYGAATGTNVAIVTYDLVVAGTIAANTTLTNTATLTNYAGTEGGPDFTTIDLTDVATVTTAPPSLTKTIVSTNQAHTTGNNVAIGEQVTYQVVMRVPEGTTPAAVMTDVLDAGLALVSINTSPTVSAGLTAANGTFGAVLAAGTIGPEPVGDVQAVNQGRRVTFNFGTLTNTDIDNATAETVTFQYTVVVLNSTGNNRGVGRNNAVSLAYTGGTATASAPNVTIVEPTLQVVKSAAPTGGDAGDPVTFTVTLSHVAGTSNTTAFDVTLADVLPAGLTFVSAAFQSGTAPTTINTTGGLAATWDTFALAATATFQVQATIDTGLASGTVLTNTANAAYTSLPTAVTTAQSPHNTLSTERTGNTGDPGGAENDYRASGSAAVTVSNAAVTKVVLSTNQAHTTGTSVAVGEILTYEVTVSVPEAVSNGVTLVDTLDPGLAFVGFDSLTVSNPGAVSTSIGGGFPTVLAGATVSNPGATADTAGSRVSFNFGVVTNTDTNSAVAETITLTYRAVVLNTVANVRGQLRNNSAAWTTAGNTVTASAPNVTIVEPTLAVNKTASPVNGDANDTVTFTITLAHSGASNTDAFDAVVSDAIPAGITVTGGPTFTSGLAPTSLTIAAGTVTGTWASFPLGSTATFTVTGTLDASIAPGTVTTNTAAAVWTSLPGAVGAAQSPFNTLSVERSGNPAAVGGAANTYTASDPATVTLNSNTISGHVYEDADNSGTRGVGEAPIAGVIVTLTGTDHLGNAVTRTAVTLPDGSYQFTGLRPGTYTVRETQPPAYADGLDAAGSEGGTVGNDVISAIDIPLGGPTTAIDYDFGERPTADLQVVKSDAPDPVVPGTALTYTLVVRNNGPSAAANVVFRDPLPTGTAFTSLTSPGMSCTTPSVGASGDVVCTVATLAAGAQTTLTLVVQVAPTLLDGAVITNAAAVRSDTPDLVPGNNSDIEPTAVAAATSADLSIVKTDAADPVVTGANIVYTLTVRNNGPAAATAVTVADTLPAGLTLVSATPSQGTCTGTTALSCVLGGLASGAQATVTVTAATSAPGVVVNTATVTGAEPDPNPINNTATEPTTVANPGDADLRVTKVDTPDPVLVDGLVAYTIVVENRGPAAAAAVTLSDPVPAGTVFESLAVPGGWTCTTPAVGAAGTVSCGAAALAVGATATFDLRVRVATGTAAGTTLTNTVVVGSATPDPDGTNNTDTEPTLVVGPGAADLAIVKTDAPDPQAAGLPVSYTLTITNNGPAVATNVAVTDPLPAGTALISASPGCSVSAGTLSCTIGTLAPGASTAVGVTISTPPLPGLLTNVATVSATETDPVPANNTEPEDTTLVQRADVRIAKAGPATATPGSAVVYTLTITNDGPSVADNVVVTDATPAGLTFVANAGACVTAFPCALGSLQPAEVRTITVTFQVPAGYTAPDPIVNVATVSTTTAGDSLLNNQATVSTPLAFAGDVQVLKTASTMSPGVGASFDYVITVTNLGPSNVTGVVITESLPAGVTYQSHVTSTGTYVPGTALWSIPALASGGGSATLTMTVRADQAGPLPNTATRTASDQPDPNSLNDAATVTPVALNQTDVAVVKTGPATVLAGATITYTLTVTNVGPAVAVGVVVTDATPANLTFVSTSGACATAFPCALGTMTVGEVRTITATYTVGNVTNGTVVTNVATVTSTTPDTNAGNNTARVDTTVDTRADVGVTKTVAPTQVAPGQTVTYTVTARNNGPNAATGVVLTDQLPAGVTYQSATASQGAYDQVTGRWAVGALAVGQTETLQMVATVDVAGAITNLAVRTTQNEPDSDPSNDSAVAVVNGEPYADIAVAKTVSAATAGVGSPVTFTIAVTNHGPFAAPAVTVDDALPAGLALVSATPSVGTFASGRWTIGQLAVGASASLTVVATVTAPGPIVNRAVVSGVGVLDPNPLNDQDSVVVNGALTANLRLAKVALRPIVGVFDYAEFVVTVTNDGPGAATSVVVTDQLPAGLSFVSARTSQGSYTPGSGVWTVGAIAASQSATLQLTTLVTTAGTVVNTATITGAGEPDPDPSDNTGTAPVVTPLPTAAQCSDVELTQTFSPTVTPGGQLRYVFTAVNRGPGYAQDVMISGMVPAGTTVAALNPSAGGSCAVVNGEIHCTWPGVTLIGPAAPRAVEVLLQVNPATPAGTIVWGWFMSMTSSPDCNHVNDMVDNYVFVGTPGDAQADLQLRGAVVAADGRMAASQAVRIGEPVTLRLAVTNHGPVPADGSYALVLSEPNAVRVLGVSVTAGGVGQSGPSSAAWMTGVVAPGATVFADIQVEATTTAAVKLLVMRTAGAPLDPDAGNDWIELAIDGVGPAPAGGRWVAAGNIDGAAGGEILTGAGEGERPQVRAFSGQGLDTGLRFNAFEPSFLGGVRLASCDVDHDGVDEIVAGQGPGGSAVKVFRVTGGVVTEVAGFLPFEAGFTGGVYVACADLNGDGRDDVVTGAGPGRAPDVRAFSVSSAGAVVVASWQAYEAGFTGGVRVATGVYPGGVIAPFQVVTTPGPGRPVDLRAWTVGGGSAVSAGSALMLPPSYTGGALVDAGDVDGDGGLDLAVAPDGGAPSLLKIFSMSTLQWLADVPAGAAGFTGGLRLDIGTLSGGPGRAELLTGQGPGGLPGVSVFQLGAGGGLQRVALESLEVP